VVQAVALAAQTRPCFQAVQVLRGRVMTAATQHRQATALALAAAVLVALVETRSAA